MPWQPHMNVISALMEIQKRPDDRATDRRSRRWCGSARCLEEVCGSCTMVINGKVRQSCTRARSIRSRPTARPITLEPMTKFPLVRDLVVDRQRIFDDLKR